MGLAFVGSSGSISLHDTGSAMIRTFGGTVMKTTFGTAAIIVLAFHALAVIKDADQCTLNWHRFQANPNRENFLAFIVADGVLTKDILAF